MQDGPRDSRCPLGKWIASDRVPEYPNLLAVDALRRAKGISVPAPVRVVRRRRDSALVQPNVIRLQVGPEV